MSEVAKFKQSEFDTIKAVAFNKYKKAIGNPPSKKAIKRLIPNPFTINALEWVAFIMLIVLTIFTSIKVGLVALPFVDNMVVTLSQHAPITPDLVIFFKVVAIALFVMLATPGLIYFKLLSDEPNLKRRIDDTAGYNLWHKLSLNWITPRLPSILVYVTVAWMFFWSSQLPGTVFEQYLGVIAEVALAQLVGTILSKRAEFERAVALAWKSEHDSYTDRINNYEQDKEYLRTLYQVMREQYIYLSRKDTNTKRTIQPNLWLLSAEDSTVDQYLDAEYKRLTSGNEFAKRIIRIPTDKSTIAINNLSEPITPPNGKMWTPEELYTNIRSRGITKYDEATLNKEYAKKYGARTAWRNGVSDRFK